MVKIKTEKKMNLAELLDYIIKNEVTDKYYFNSARNAVVKVTMSGFIYFSNTFKPDDTFTVEVEEEITEETEIPLLLEVRNELLAGQCTVTHRNVKISEVLDKKQDHVGIVTITIHKINPDGTTSLLWTKEGGMQ